MLAKKFRLTTEAFRLHARQKPLQTTRSASFVVKAFPGTAEHPRFGIVIGKNVDARSSARNRVKRLVYDVCGGVLNHLTLADYICIIQPSAAKKTKKELQNELVDVLERELK